MYFDHPHPLAPVRAEIGGWCPSSSVGWAPPQPSTPRVVRSGTRLFSWSVVPLTAAERSKKTLGAEGDRSATGRSVPIDDVTPNDGENVPECSAGNMRKPGVDQFPRE
jgi:hypothetical protein